MADQIHLLIFDLGSTLFHEGGPWEQLYKRADEALWRALQDAGVPLDARTVYGDSANLFELYYALHRSDLNEPTTREVLDQLLQSRGYRLPAERLQAALQAMYVVTRTNWQVEADAIPTLETLKTHGFRIGAISNGADDENMQALIDKGGVRPYLEHIVSSAAFGKRKPHRDIFQEALNQFGIPAGEAVMIGDDYEADIVGAQGVGMRSIWITRRVREPVAIRAEGRPMAVVSTLSEIPAVLKGK